LQDIPKHFNIDEYFPGYINKYGLQESIEMYVKYLDENLKKDNKVIKLLILRIKYLIDGKHYANELVSGNVINVMDAPKVMTR